MCTFSLVEKHALSFIVQSKGHNQKTYKLFGHESNSLKIIKPMQNHYL